MDYSEEGKIIILAVLVVIIVGFFSVLLFVIFLKRKNQVIKNKEDAEQMYKQELIKTQIEIQSETMKHIGREIHDNIGQKLTLASLYTQQLAFENKAPQVNKNIDQISSIINESLMELRQLSKSLTDDIIESLLISQLIAKECQKINELKKCSVSFTTNAKADISPYQIKRILLRITQEFLQNSIKHADCKHIEVALDKQHNQITLILKDDGKGFNVNAIQSSGIGLKNIKRRTELVGGTYTLESQPSTGVQLTIKIPIL